MVDRKENRVDVARHKLAPLVPEVPSGSGRVGGSTGSGWIRVSDFWQLAGPPTFRSAR
jgi:hypothetical protein